MKNLKSISYNHIIHSSSFFTKILILLTFNIFILINCEENYDNNIIDNNHLFLILEKDGYLRAFEKKDINEKWKIYFNISLFPKNTNSYKLTDDIVIYPINDKLYLSFENNFVPFDIFVKNLINNKPITKDSISIEGLIKKYFYIIDLNTGKTLEKNINNNNIDNIHNIKHDEIIFKKVDYYLIKKEINRNENLMNISYSDINIEAQNDDNNNNMNDMHHIINYFKLNLEIDKIISIHSYNYNKGKLILIYDKNILEKKFNSGKIINTNIFNNNKKSLNEEKNYFKEFYNDIVTRIVNISNNLRNYFFIILIAIIIMIFKFKHNIFIINFNKTNIINKNYNYKFPENTNSIVVERNRSIINDINNNRNINNKEICHKINDFSIISKTKKLEISEKIEINTIKNDDNNPTENIKKHLSNELSIVKKLNFKQLVPKSYSSPVLLPSEEKQNKLFFDPNNNLDLEELKNHELDDDEYFKSYKISKSEHKNKFPIINDNFNDILKILNSKNTILKKQSVDIHKLGRYDEHNYYISFKINTEHMYNCLISNDEMPKFMTNNNFINFKKNLLPDENLKNIEKKMEKIVNFEDFSKIDEKIEEFEENYSKKSTKEKTNNSNKSEKKIGAGIWDDDDDEDEEEVSISKYIKNDKNNNTNISISENKDISKSNKNKVIKENTININLDKDNDNIKNTNEIINKSRLDKDFKNLEKIGKGGFGIVLKGEHRLDKGICAIKIIKLKDINDKESIINEAITMTKLTSKHVVQYKTCWIDNNLGTASKLFNNEDQDDDNEIDNLSLNLNKSTIVNKNEKLKTIKNNTIIDDDEDDEEIEEENDKSSNNNDLSLSRKISNLYFNNKKDNSQELKKKGSKYCCNYRDDSHIITKSIISNKYIKDNNAKSENLNEDEYFFILMEYCDGLTLEQYIKQYAGKSIDRKIIYNFTSQILKSLVKIHSTGIIHRDIKPCNIFIKNDQIKIGDFGLATRYSNTGKLLKSKKIEGTPLYLSPEQKNFKTYNEKVDIYACGITLYEMCSCFSTEMERCNDIINLKNENKINERVSKNYPEESALIKLMTKSDYNERPSAREILESEPFINLGKTLGC